MEDNMINMKNSEFHLLRRKKKLERVSNQLKDDKFKNELEENRKRFF